MKNRVARVVASVAFALLIVSAGQAGADRSRTNAAPGLGSYDEPFWADGDYRDNVKSPSEFLGFEMGSRPIKHEEMMRYFRYLDENFPTASLMNYAKSYEGRQLVYLVVTGDEHAGELESIRRSHEKLADPRLIGNAEAEQIIAAMPAVAWMAYGIHGDELSSSDAAVQLAYQLVAGEDETTRFIRKEVITLIDPMENPDGRMRWLKQVEQWNSVVTSTDIQSLHHRGMWPYGRGNHYLFDLNRDWFALVHPESRGRAAAILEWNPQFLLDCHEMGPTNTYLFSPPREPFNPFMISQIHKWWDVFAKDQATAMDRYGWSYYTREWNEEFFPGYGSSWGIYVGAIGMLYEQAGVDGSQVKRPDGTITTFRETVHHQFISSMANLETVARNRRALLEDFHNEKKTAVGKGDGKKKAAGAFLFPPSDNESRLRQFAETLMRQNIEVEVASDNFGVRKAKSSLGIEANKLNLPRNTLIVRVNQPLRALIEVILSFDIRIESSFLETERKERLKNNGSRLYESTGWSMALAYNLESYYVESMPDIDTSNYESQKHEGRIIGEMPKFGYAIDNADDHSMNVLVQLFRKNYRVWAATKPFQVQDHVFGRGSLLIRLNANPNLNEEDLAAIARSEGVDIYGVNTSLGGTLADLGGNEFTLLEAPRIGLVGGTAVSTYEFGAVWHLLDNRMMVKTSTLEIGALPRMDPRKYNVIVLPSTWYDDVYKRMLGKNGISKLKDWVKDGGTLIAMGNASAFLADSSVALSSVRKRSQILKDLA
jgi:hypothetical protein